MIAAVGMVRDEDDIIVPVICQLLAQGVDAFWVADNMSSDKTRPQLDELAARHPITVIDDPVPGFYQAMKTTALARMAITAGADWVIPFDADEWFYALDGTIASTLADVDADVVLAAGYDHLPRPDDPDDDNPVRRMGWRRPHPQKYPKVIFRAAPDVFVHQGNHNVEHPGRRLAGFVEYRHYQYRTLEQMARKVRQGAAAYAASTMDAKHGTHWKALAALSDAELAAEWDALCTDPHVIYDPAPMP
jgi:glycosyltransferase involved in cell wall biosynthesis